MALTVEDGTGLDEANAYISIEDADDYHVDRNNIAWAALSEAEKTAAIIYATAYLDGKYDWRGDIVSETQALGLPTENGIDDEGRDIEGVPVRVANATAELALIHVSNPINSTLGPRVVSQTVVGAVSRTFSDRAGNEGQRYPLIEKMLKGLHHGGNAQFLESMGA